MRLVYYNPSVRSSTGSGIHSRKFAECAYRVLGSGSFVMYPPLACASQLTKTRRRRFRFLPARGKYAAIALSKLAASRCVLRALRQHLAGSDTVILIRYGVLDFPALLLMRRSIAPVVLEVNGPLFVELEHFFGAPRSLVRLTQKIELEMWHRAAGIITVSNVLRDMLVRMGVDASKILVNPNGVDPNEFVPHKTEEGSTVAIGFVGHVQPWHGLPLLMAAFKTVHDVNPDTRLVIVGADTKQVLHLARKYSVDADAVECLQHVNHDDVPVILSRVDIAVAPYNLSTDFYFSPLKLFEYMAAGTAIVASSVGQIAEVLTHEKNGLLVSPGDVNALAASIIRLAANRDLRRRLGSHARVTAMGYTWERNVHATLEFCDRILRDRAVMAR